MEDATRKSGDLWSGVALAALGLYIIIQAGQWEYLGPEGPGAGFFPLWYGVAILALSVLLVVSHCKRGCARGDATDWYKLDRELWSWVGFGVSVGLFEPLRFVIRLALLTYCLLAVLYHRL